MIEIEPDIEKWMDSLPVKDFATVLASVERLAKHGSRLRGAASRALGKGLFKLRMHMGRSQWRITYYFADRKRIVLLTVFRKQRRNEQAKIRHARQVMKHCMREDPTAQEDDR